MTLWRWKLHWNFIFTLWIIIWFHFDLIIWHFQCLIFCLTIIICPFSFIFLLISCLFLGYFKTAYEWFWTALRKQDLPFFLTMTKSGDWKWAKIDTLKMKVALFLSVARPPHSWYNSLLSVKGRDSRSHLGKNRENFPFIQLSFKDIWSGCQIDSWPTSSPEQGEMFSLPRWNIDTVFSKDRKNRA